MRARSTVLELADTALPLFGDPEREYDYLQALQRYRAIDGGLEAEVASFEGRAALALRFVSPAATAAEVHGDASQVREERVDGGLSLALRIDGRARLNAHSPNTAAGSS